MRTEADSGVAGCVMQVLCGVQDGHQGTGSGAQTKMFLADVSL